jgi:hypothetical protein
MERSENKTIITIEHPDDGEKICLQLDRDERCEIWAWVTIFRLILIFETFDPETIDQLFSEDALSGD